MYLQKLCTGILIDGDVGRMTYYLSEPIAPWLKTNLVSAYPKYGGVGRMTLLKCQLNPK